MDCQPLPIMTLNPFRAHFPMDAEDAAEDQATRLAKEAAELAAKQSASEQSAGGRPRALYRHPLLLQRSDTGPRISPRTRQLSSST